MKIPDLTDDESSLLIIAMGLAGVASCEHNIELFYDLMRLANKVNLNNPRWIPYKVPEQKET
jgi:hypothetical protein